MDPQSTDAAPQIENKIPARVCSHNGKKFTVAKNLIIAELDEPEAAGLASYSHAARSPENVLYAGEANFSGVGVCKQLEFRDKFHQARLRRHRMAGFLFICAV